MESEGSLENAFFNRLIFSLILTKNHHQNVCFQTEKSKCFVDFVENQSVSGLTTIFGVTS